MLPASQLKRLIEIKEQRAIKSSLNLSMISTRWVIRQYIIFLLLRSVNRFQVFMSWSCFTLCKATCLLLLGCPDTHQPRHKSAPQDIPGYQHAAGGRLALGRRRTYRTASGKWVWGWGWGEIITIWAHRHAICLGGHTCPSYYSPRDPGPYRGHLHYDTDGWTHKHGGAFVHWEMSGTSLSKTQKIKYVWMGRW